MLATFRPNKQLVAIKVLKKKSAKTNTYTITKEAYFLKISRGCAFLSHSYAVLQTEVTILYVYMYVSFVCVCLRFSSWHSQTLSSLSTHQKNYFVNVNKFTLV
ncbi:hypothetical protein XENTR_v10013585 [Xenopus tropicalis]|nr:hypothetical protein XENTR_v10013585 [Xenopus tropicalis]